jgi:hypothetical protein
MGLFRKKTNTRKKRNEITRKKTRSSRKRRGGESSMKGTPSLSDSMKRTFPMVTKFPSCQRCMDAMDSVKTVSPSKNAKTVSPSKNAKTVSLSNQPYQWTDADIAILGKSNSNSNSHNSDNLSSLEGSPNYKTPSPIKRSSTKIRHNPDNPYRTGGPGPKISKFSGK